MHSINLTIKKNYVKQNGTTPVYLLFNYSREKRLFIKTGKSIDPKYWNPKLKFIRRKHPDYDHLSQYLKSLKLKLEYIVDESILKGKTPTISYIEEQFTLKTSPEKNQKISFLDRYDEYIESKKGHVVKDVIKDYNSLKKHLKGFEKHKKRKIVFSDITPKFYDQFVYYLSYVVVKKNKEVGMRKSTVGKLIKNLKVFLNFCMRNNYTPIIDLTAFKSLTGKASDIYISDEELDLMLKLDLSDDIEFDRLRDLFIIGCETGLRYSDFSRLTRYHIDINKRVIRLTMKKTLGSVVIPISKRLQKVLEKYDYHPPTDITSNYFNKNIKTIAEKAKINTPVTKIKEIGNQKIEENFLKYECVSTHTCRRSFCTNQFLNGMPAMLIRRISGHTDEKSFLLYIKIDEEQAAMKMLELWVQKEKQG